MNLDTVTVAVLFMKPTLETTPVRAIGGIVEERNAFVCHCYYQPLSLAIVAAKSLMLLSLCSLLLLHYLLLPSLFERSLYRRGSVDQGLSYAATSSDWVRFSIAVLGAYLDFFRSVGPYLVLSKTCIKRYRAFHVPFEHKWDWHHGERNETYKRCRPLRTKSNEHPRSKELCLGQRYDVMAIRKNAHRKDGPSQATQNGC
jgi:hypothetical protein